VVSYTGTCFPGSALLVVTWRARSLAMAEPLFSVNNEKNKLKKERENWKKRQERKEGGWRGVVVY